jgi:threonyl-tRNA synthetase
MFDVYLKDGSLKQFESPVNPGEVAKSISPSLAKKCVAAWVNGQEWDLMRPVPQGATLDLITLDNPHALEIIRHDTAHILAAAVKELFPETQITIGPSIENGFYYDFYREKSFTLDDLSVIEKRMNEIVDRADDFIREEWERDKAIEFFKSQGELFKAELIEAIPQGEIISLYRMGNFIDLCRGPHMPSTKNVGHAFKLMKLAGAYWRGDHRNPMLQRIYGTAWATEEQLKNYLFQLEEAEKRDHRKLGSEMDLFHIQEEAPGSVFWHPKGWTIYNTLEQYMRQHLQRKDYVEVKTPQFVDRSLWEASGHWEMFGKNMFTLQSEDKTMAVKPMNCPCHVEIFKKGIKSYRDLPLRMAEFGSCHRNEPSGSLHGLMRVRAFVQDDAHIFCTPEQIISETKLFCNFLKEIYADFGFTNINVKFSDRPLERAGSDDIWDQAESALKEATLAAGLDFTINPGEGAFYGPKLEFVLRDAIGRDWQCGTFQVDFVLPERLGAEYVGEDGKRHRPVMLHRAILGSFERFIGVLIEHYGGKFPLWLSPVHAVVSSVVSDANDYAAEVYEMLKSQGVRAELDIRNEKISYKIREHSLQKIPFILAIGKREAENKEVTVRTLGESDQRTLATQEFLRELMDKIKIPGGR